MTTNPTILTKKEISTLKRYTISAIRIFLGAFIVTFGAQLAVMPQTGLKEFVASTILSSVIAGVTAVLKWAQESLFVTRQK